MSGAPLPVAVVGAGMIDFGELFHMSYEDMVVEQPTSGA